MNRHLNYIYAGIAAVAILLGLPGCKPTEAGYRSAYDAALEKRQAAEQEMHIPGMIADYDGLRMQTIDSDSIWVSHEILRGIPAEGIDTLCIQPYGVGVAMFRFDTNALSMASDLRRQKHKAFVATDGKDKWYVVADAYPTLDDAVKGWRDFRRRHPKYYTIGLPAPILLHLIN